MNLPLINGCPDKLFNYWLKRCNMKKNKHIVAKAALGTYFFVLGIGLIFHAWERNTTKYNANHPR